jgi:hypothetical protein
VNNPKTLTEFLSRRKACDGCITKKLHCVPYQLLFLGIIGEEVFHECPCIECIVKVVCDQCCTQFDKYVDEHYVIISSQSLPAIEHILTFYKEINKHLDRKEIDLYNMVRISEVYYTSTRRLTTFEEEMVRNVSERFKPRRTLPGLS